MMLKHGKGTLGRRFEIGQCGHAPCGAWRGLLPAMLREPARRQKAEGSRQSALRTMLVSICLLLSAFCFPPSVLAQTRTTVADTIHAPDGSLPTGQIIISAPSTFTAADGTVVFQGTVATAAVTNGAFSVGLVPNAGSSPSGTSYKALYELSGVAYRSETWVIPSSANPVNLAVVRSIVLSGPSAMVAAAQLPATINASAIEDKGGQVFNVKAYGFVGDGATDNTAAFNSLLAAVYAANGGTILFPCGGAYLFNGQIVLPNDGNSSEPKQPPIRLTSTCAESQNNNVNVSSGGAVLDFRYSGTYGQLVTQGLGTLEIDHLIFEDNGSGSTPFFYDTNTTTYIHDDIFQGNTTYGPPTNNPTKDAIIFGGTSWTAAITSLDTYFRGFGSRIIGSTFAHVRHAAVLNVDSNGVVVRDNMVNVTCGSGTAGDAPFVIQGDGTHYTSGVLMSGNLIEEYGYTYGIKLASTVIDSVFEANNFYDSASSTADYDAENSTTNSNTFIAGEGSAPAILRSGVTPVVNTVINPTQGTTVSGTSLLGSYFPQGLIFDRGQDQVQYTNEYGGTIKSAAGDIFRPNFTDYGGGNMALNWLMTPNGGAQVLALQMYQTASDADLQCGKATCWVKSGGGDLRLVANSAGGVTWIGNSSGQPSYFSNSLMHVGTKAEFTGQIVQTPVAFVSAPACNSGNEGSVQAITDSTVNTWGSAIAGGGGNHVLGYCDGTNWTVAAK